MKMLMLLIALLTLGACDENGCSAGETRCSDDVVEVCDVAGSWREVADCGDVTSEQGVTWSCCPLDAYGDGGGLHACLPFTMCAAHGETSAVEPTSASSNRLLETSDRSDVRTILTADGAWASSPGLQHAAMTGQSDAAESLGAVVAQVCLSLTAREEGGASRQVMLCSSESEELSPRDVQSGRFPFRTSHEGFQALPDSASAASNAVLLGFEHGAAEWNGGHSPQRVAAVGGGRLAMSSDGSFPVTEASRL